jgi:hypothetical protein
MLAKSLPGIRRNSHAESGSEPATKWGCDADTTETMTAEIITEQMVKSSFLRICGSIVPGKSGFGNITSDS